MYFQINKLIPAYFFITYYPFMESFRSLIEVNTLLLYSLPLLFDNLI
jgi:hypothetical protein